MEDALEGLFQAVAGRADKVIGERPARHAHRTADNGHIFLARRQIGLLEALVGIAFMGGHKTRAHLDARSAEIKKFLDVRAGIDTAGRNDGHRAAVGVLQRLDRFHHLRHQNLQRMAGLGYLVPLEAEMAAGLGALDHIGIRQVAETGQPLLGDDRCRTPGGDDGHELGLEFLFLFLAEFAQVPGHVERQARPGKDDVHLAFNGFAHHLAERGERHHDVDADDAAAEFAGLAYLVAERADVGLNGIFCHIRLPHADHGAGNDADPPLIGNGGSKPGEGDADAHAPLDDGNSGNKIAKLQDWKRHDLNLPGLLAAVAGCRRKIAGRIAS